MSQFCSTVALLLPQLSASAAESCILPANGGVTDGVRTRALRSRGVKPAIARRGTEHGSGLGRWRWVVERTFAWLHNYRRLRIRWERNPVVHMAFLTLACALICQRCLRGF
jgi:transposase